MRSRRLASPAVLALFLVADVAWAQDRAQAEPEPRRTDLVEQAETRLTQLDISVSGPPELIGNLEAADFWVKIGRRRIRDFLVDRHCAASAGAAASGDAASSRALPTPPLSILFYFDQTHLTLPGRARAFDLARELVKRLVVGGNRGMIVSSARRLEVIEPLTDDGARLTDALKRLEGDRTQWDFFATEEESRVGRVVDALDQDDDVYRAISIARSYQREEHWRADKALRRLELALTYLVESDSYKAVVYFADTMRDNAGEHYLSFFGSNVQRSTPALGQMGLDGLTAGLAFDAVINTATARGIRFYTVHARGLVVPQDRSLPSAGAVSRSGAPPSSSRIRYRDAEDAMSNLSGETGGAAFVRGESAARIDERVRADYSCIYTLSFDPAGLEEDAPLRAVVDVVREGVTSRSKGRVVVESETVRLNSRLLAAFAGATDVATGVQASLVPTGFADGAYSALLQVSVPGTALPAASWDLGSSVLHRDKVVREISGSLAVRQRGVPLILEGEVRLRPGAHEIVAVAHESTTDLIFSEHVQVAWPDPDDRPATCGPIALVQQIDGAFLRDGDSRISGSLSRAEGAPARSGLPTALLGLICRNRRQKGPLEVERTLIGESRVEFPELEVDLGKERCAQIRDLIPEGSLGPGYYRYVVRLLQDGAVLDEGNLEFVAVPPPDGPSEFDR